MRIRKEKKKKGCGSFVRRTYIVRARVGPVKRHSAIKDKAELIRVVDGYIDWMDIYFPRCLYDVLF